VKTRRLWTLSLTVETLDDGTLDDSTVFVSHPHLPVHGYGETLSDALAAFGAMWEAQWATLVEGDPAGLTDVAKRARGRFVAIAAGEETDHDGCLKPQWSQSVDEKEQG